MGRGKLALRSALSAADGGELAHAAAQLRRLLGYLGADADPALLCRVNERLGILSLATSASRRRPRPRHRPLSTHCRGTRPAGSRRGRWPPTPGRCCTAPIVSQHAPVAEQALAAARAAGAPWVEADAQVTLGLISERAGKIADAIGLFTTAHRQAAEARVLGVELRAAFQLARVQLEQGDLAARPAPRTRARRRARGSRARPGASTASTCSTCTTSRTSPTGRWDHAAEIADGFPVRVTSVAEARLSAMALFVAVGQGTPGGGGAAGLAGADSGRRTGSPSTSPGGCWPSTRSGGAIPRERWPRRRHARPRRPTRTATGRR